MASDPAELLPGVLDAVAAASTAILEVYASALDRRVQGRRLADHARRPGRARDPRDPAGVARPAIPVLSEEAEAAHAFEVRRGWRELWLVDPLDGTREFIGRNGEFTVNVALVRDHVPVLGVVAAPALGLTYYAARGHGAWCSDGKSGPKSIRVRAASDPLVVVGSRSHRGDSLDGLLAKLGPHELRPMGSALKFCLVAEGAADFYPRLGLTSEWDTAAAQAVLEVAGGAVTTLDGAPLRYNARDTLLNPHFIAYGDSTRDWPSLF